MAGARTRPSSAELLASAVDSLEQIGLALTRLERLSAAALDLSAAQLRSLVLMAGRDGRMAIGDLADAQGLAPSTLTRNMALLVRRGLVAREVGEADRRVVEVVLTAAGAAAAAAASDTMRRSLVQAVHQLAVGLEPESRGNGARAASAARLDDVATQISALAAALARSVL